MPDVITLAQLEALGTCGSQLSLFREHFPSGEVRIAIDHAIALAGVFDWDLAARRLLTAKARRAYEAATEEAWRIYQSAKVEALCIYYDTKAKVFRVYDTATAEDRRAFEATMDEAWRTFCAARAKAQHSYHVTRAEAFARAYLSQ